MKCKAVRGTLAGPPVQQIVEKAEGRYGGGTCESLLMGREGQSVEVEMHALLKSSSLKTGLNWLIGVPHVQSFEVIVEQSCGSRL